MAPSSVRASPAGSARKRLSPNLPGEQPPVHAIEDGIRSMNDICRRSIEREMLSPEFLWASATGWIGDGGVG
jgi:hypothetical protein